MDEKILRDVARWLSPADLRRARSACKAWHSALGTYSTAATTPSEASTVTVWKAQLEAMVHALPCLQQLTIGSRLSAVGAQQLVVLAEAKQLRALHIPHAHSLQDRSLQALTSLAPTLKELKMNGAASLSSRSLLILSVLGQLEALELTHCGKISWYELQKAWQSACLAYEAQLGEARATPLPGGGSSGSVYSKIGGWLPTGGLFRTASPGSGTIQAALKHQQPQQQQQSRTGAAGIFSKIHGKGILGGAVGNGRSSTGGSSHEGAVRKLLYGKLQTQLNSTTAQGFSLGPRPQHDEAWVCGTVTEGAEGTEESASDAATEVEGLAKIDTASASLNSQASTAVSSAVGTSVQPCKDESGDGAAANSQSGTKQALVAPPPPVAVAVAAAAATGSQLQRGVTDRSASTSALSRVGSLVRQGTTAAAAALSLSSGSSVTRQCSTVQSALLAYLSGNPGAHWQTASQTGRSSGGGSKNGSTRACRDGKLLPAMPFTKLTMLSFTCSESTFKNPGPELAAVASLTTLKQLEMTKCKLPDAAFGHLTCLTRLDKLKLSGLWLMGDTGLANIAEITSLRSLALSEAMHVTAHGLMALGQLTALTSLALGLAQDLGSGSIAQAVSNLDLLRCLEVNAPCWDDVDCHLLAAADAVQSARDDTSHGSSGNAGLNQLSLPAAGVGANSPGSWSIQRQQQLAAPIMLWQLIGPLDGAAGHSNSDKAGALHSQSSSCSNSFIANVRSPASRACSFSSMNSFGSFSTWSGTDAASRVAAAVPCQKQRLQVLKLHGCRMMTHRGLEAIRQLSELHMFVIDNCREVRTAETISQDLVPPKISSLALRHMAFGNVFNGCIGVPACAGSLTKLELVSQSDVHVGQMRRVLSFFPQLQVLDLSGCQDLGESLLCHLPLLPKLQQLSLSGTRITGEAFDQLVHLQELQVLRCKGCNLLTDSGLVSLWRLLSLQELDVSDCHGLSDKGLLAMMLNAAGLVRLDVRGCRSLTREAVRRCPYYLKLLHSL